MSSSLPIMPDHSTTVGGRRDGQMLSADNAVSWLFYPRRCKWLGPPLSTPPPASGNPPGMVPRGRVPLTKKPI